MMYSLFVPKNYGMVSNDTKSSFVGYTRDASEYLAEGIGIVRQVGYSLPSNDDEGNGLPTYSEEIDGLLRQEKHLIH